MTNHSCATSEDEALDRLYADFEGRLVERRFIEVDRDLTSFDVTAPSEALLVGVLAVTLPWRKSLPSRDALVKRVADELARRKTKRIDRLLAGLY